MRFWLINSGYYRILTAVMFAPVRFTLSPDVLYKERVVPSAAAVLRMVLDRFAEFAEVALSLTISFASAEPFAYNCADRFPSVVRVPVAP